MLKFVVPLTSNEALMSTKFPNVENPDMFISSISV